MNSFPCVRCNKPSEVVLIFEDKSFGSPLAILLCKDHESKEEGVSDYYEITSDLTVRLFEEIEANG